jgi:hypothetical protein
MDCVDGYDVVDNAMDVFDISGMIPIVYPLGIEPVTTPTNSFKTVLSINDRACNALVEGNKYMLKACIQEYIKLLESTKQEKEKYGQHMYTVGEDVDEFVGRDNAVVIDPEHFMRFNECCNLIKHITDRLIQLKKMI